MRQRILEEEQMLQQRNQYFCDIKKSMHDEVRSMAAAGKEEQAHVIQQKHAETVKMKELQAAQQNKIREQQQMQLQKRREKTMSLKDSIAEKTRKSVQDLKDAKRGMVE